MCLVLQHQWTGFRKTDSVIKHMALYTISTGLITSVLACVILVLTKYKIFFGLYAIGTPMGGIYSITMLTNLHMRTRLRARLDTPSLIEYISLSIKKRVRRNVGDHGNEERLQAVPINISREVVRNDVDIKEKSKVQFPGVQSPVSDMEPEPNAPPPFTSFHHRDTVMCWHDSH